jgi:hypothetical protein
MDPKRLVQISFIIASSFAIYGGHKTLGIFFSKNSALNNKILCSMIILLLLTGGTTKFFPELLNDHPSSIAISQKNIFKNTDNIYGIVSFFMSVTPTYNILLGKWMSEYRLNDNIKIYRGDWIEHYPSLYIYNNIDGDNIITTGKVNIYNNEPEVEFNSIKELQYLQLTYPNIKFNIYWTWYNQVQQVFNYNGSHINTAHYAKLYDNGYTQLYLTE